MQFYGATLLALSALQGAAAFNVQTPQAVPTALSMSSYDEAVGLDVRTDTGVMPGSGYASTSANAFNSRAMEARLARLETGNPSRRGFTPSYDREMMNDNDALRIIEETEPVPVQGGSLKTWSFASPRLERVQVCLRTDGRPLEANVDLWQGPDNTPHKMRVYVEDGAKRPFNAVVETPRGPNTIAIRNTGQLEFPIDAHVAGESDNKMFAPRPISIGPESEGPRTIQGGALRTYPFDPFVDSVQVLLRTDGRPLNARIELLQGPNNNKQVIEVYTEDGLDRPFFIIIETPGSGNVVRVVNSATVEFPMTATVEAYSLSDASATDAVMGGDSDFVLGGDSGTGFSTDRGFFSSDRRY